MKLLLPNIFQWSWFSQEKQLDFNGLFLTVGEHRILVDPPPLPPEEAARIKQGGPVDYVVVTNRDHEREAEACRTAFQCRVFVPEADAPQMGVKADKTYKDGELLPGGMWVVQLQNQKSPGESALFLPQGKGVMIVGDALIGAPAGSLRLLPAEKYADTAMAKEGLRRLLKYNFDAILVGDGASILAGAKAAAEQALR
jgi:glyoxylase-like metal-dependent hydrolase (beta-lactamase superfamily II)